MELDTVVVWMRFGDAEFCISASPNEAFAMMSMPALAGVITRLEPSYGLPSLSEPENLE